MGRRKGEARKGVLTDDNGIVVSRTHRHPLAYLFRAVSLGVGPNGQPLPMTTIPEDMAQVLAIQVFDNFGCGGPGSGGPQRIRMAAPEEGPDVWTNPPRLVPASTPFSVAPAADVAADDDELPDVDLDGLPDTDEYTDEQLVIIEKRMARTRNDRKIKEGFDGQGTSEEEARWAGMPDGFREKDAQMRAAENRARQDQRESLLQQARDVAAKGESMLGRPPADEPPITAPAPDGDAP